MAQHKLPELPYSYDSLEPYIDARTMEIHLTKHHNAYVTNLNAALEQVPRLQGAPLEQLVRDLASVPEDVRTAVRNNAGGHLNHSMFWRLMGPKQGGEPVGRLADEIKKTFGSADGLREQFKKAALGRFGSGWAWLSRSKEGTLVVHSTANQDNPLMEGFQPILGLDVWEHAYYLKYQNRRPDYVDAFFKVVDWRAAAEIFVNLK